ncbi:MAG: hypothetical protein EPN69_01770 [Rhodanobacter sp.]|nr:MAG: hypothetical protein EPN69_01770 [Rhodanobacter sp.]TAM41584.1 MAG: hypothetical protein EPN58_06360 [Rhodanobacter sp.]TAN28309.1 MAG: hypothetical protein EPN32_03005 [Rhodanobacter sp.]
MAILYEPVGLWLDTTSVAVTSIATTHPRSGLAARIDALIEQPRFAHASWGIAVVSLDSGRTLYAHRADRLGQPGSTAKLFTAAVSLATLGPDYRFPTRLLSRGAIRHGRLDGHLILYGMGDPTLGTAGSSDWAEQLASQLHARGINLYRVPGGDTLYLFGNMPAQSPPAHFRLAMADPARQAAWTRSPCCWPTTAALIDRSSTGLNDPRRRADDQPPSLSSVSAAIFCGVSVEA